MPPANASGPGWGSLSEDLVCAVAELLPVRECYGALPLLNRHFYAISQRWPIQCGVYLLAEPAGRITKKGVERRSQGLLRWLARHNDQLQLFADDVPVELQLAVAGQRSLYFGHEPLLTLLEPTVAAILKQHCGALVNLTLWLPDPSPAAGQSSAGPAGGPSPLEGHTSLTRLRLHNFRGTAADLAALLAPATQLGQLELVIGDFQMHPQLLAGMQSQPALCSLLKVLTFNDSSSGKRSHGKVYGGQLFPSMAQGLLACTALCSLSLDLIDNLPKSSPELPLEISKLSRLTDLSLAADWSKVPEVLNQLPLRSLKLSHCKLGSARFSSESDRNKSSGIPRALRALAPTLKRLAFEQCHMSSLPLVVSCFTGLTSLTLWNNENLSDVPSWLAALTALKVLHFLSAGRDTTETQHLPNVLDALPSLQELRWEQDTVYTIRQGAYLSRLTSLSLGCSPYPEDDQSFLDISALKDASCLLDLSLSYECEDPRGALRGAHALADLSLTSLCLSELRSNVLPPPGAYLSSLKHLSLSNCKAKKAASAQLPSGLTAATGLAQLSILCCEGLRVDDIWLQLAEMLPCWPLLIEMELTERIGKGDMTPCNLLAGEALADAQMASESDGEEGEE